MTVKFHFWQISAGFFNSMDHHTLIKKLYAVNVDWC